MLKTTNHVRAGPVSHDVVISVHTTDLTFILPIVPEDKLRQTTHKIAYRNLNHRHTTDKRKADRVLKLPSDPVMPFSDAYGFYTAEHLSYAQLMQNQFKASLITLKNKVKIRLRRV